VWSVAAMSALGDMPFIGSSSRLGVTGRNAGTGRDHVVVIAARVGLVEVRQSRRG
jgi:hypothetical protein